MFRNAYQRDWAIVASVCFVAMFLFVSTLGFSSAVSKSGVITVPINEKVSPCVEGEEGANCYPDCALPTPAPACTTGDTLCSEGTGGVQCHATTYTCAGTPGAFTTPGARCNYNACTGTPGTVGSKCQ